MKQQRHPKQYTIRHVPPEVDEALRRQARAQRRSLNQIAVEALSQAAGLTHATVKKRDMRDLAGTWESDRAFDRVIEEMDRVDPEIWS